MRKHEAARRSPSETALKRFVSRCGGWANFNQRLQTIPLSEAGKLFEVFCKYYFLAEPTVKDDYRNVWLFRELPSAIKQKLNLGQIEHGVDLVLESTDGKFAAVQCKYRKNEKSRLSWSKDKISNLFGYASHADQFIVFTNASEIDSVSKSRAPHFSFFNNGDLLHIKGETFRAVEKLLAGRPLPKPKKLSPFDHQKQAIRATLKHFKFHDRGQLILPCGAGKTFTALWLKERLKAQNTLVLVPSLALLRQIKNQWAEQKTDAYAYMCVCSEADIARDEDATEVHTYEVGGPVTTDPGEIFQFLTRGKKKRVIFSTYHSLHAIAQALRTCSFSFDLMICDEAHKTTGSKTEGFALAHDNRKIRAFKRLYMTATPRVLSASIKSKMGDDIEYLCDMGNREIYGDEIYRLSFKNAIDLGILVDYKIVAVGVTNKELKEYLDERRYISAHETIDELASNYALNRVMRKYGAAHAVTYHSRVKSAEKFSERHKKMFPAVFSSHVKGEQATSLRSMTLKAFDQSGVGVVSNARCLVEGIDLPSIDMVYFCDPKNSKIDIVQASGRALRLDHSRNKKLGFIVVPVFHSAKNRIEEAVENSVFKNLIQVVRALCDQDERLQEEITKLVYGKGQRRTGKAKISISMGRQEKVVSLVGFASKLKQALFDQIIEKSVINWDVQYKRLIEFRKKFPNRWPAFQEEYPKNNTLGRWCATQRRLKNTKELSCERASLLDKIGFEWNPINAAWQEQYQYLVEYREKHPDRWPSINDEYPKGNVLGSWCADQRKRKRQGVLSKKRISLLDKISFEWGANETAWLKQFRYLVSYRKKHPAQWPSVRDEYPKGNKLGVWCSQQRFLNRSKKLAPERKALLERIGFVWELLSEAAARLEEIWLAQYQLLIRYRKEYPNQWPAQNEQCPKGNNFGDWCSTQRIRYQEKKLSTQRIDLLEKIGFEWSPKEIGWQKQYHYLVEFRRKHPNQWPDFETQYPTGNRIGYWCHNQRQFYRRNQLSPEKIKKLENIGFYWGAKDALWDRQYNYLKEYRKKYLGKWPKAKEEFPLGNPLGSWCVTQRWKFKKKKLRKERIAFLNKIRFEWSLQRSHA